MSSTKIINVLKDDSFQEILDLFKATPAQEVIFVLPKNSKAFKKEDHFVTLRSEAKDLQKSVSFLCSNPELNEIAKKYNFDVLLARSPVPRKPAQSKKASINVVNQIEDFYAEPALDADSISISQPAEENEPEDEDPEPVIATAAVTQAGRRLDDIVLPEHENRHNIKVSGASEKAMPVQIRKDLETEVGEDEALNEIKNVWSAQSPPPQIKTANASWSSWFRRSKTRSPRSSWPIRKPGHRFGLAALACGALIVLGTVIFITTGKAQVTIKPSEQPLDLRLTITASDNIPAIDPVNLAIPGQVFNIQKTVTQTLPATGHVDVAQKARGTITVYNELAAVQPLIATTRFESSDHHIFHTLTTISISPSKTVNGKLIPGSAEVQVIADKPGSDYNVPVGLFTIPAFKEKGDTVKYQKVYGQSTAEMHSGTSGQAVIATETDLASAKKALTTQLTQSVQSELRTQVSDLKVINDSQVNVGQFTSSASADAKTSTFNANLSGSLKTVGFKQSDLDSLIAQYVDTHKNIKVIAEKLTLAYENIHWDDAKNALVFNVHITGPGYAKIDEQRIISDLLGKNDPQIKAYLGEITGIASANVSLSPFWVRSIPKNHSKVHIQVTY